MSSVEERLRAESWFAGRAKLVQDIDLFVHCVTADDRREAVRKWILDAKRSQVLCFRSFRTFGGSGAKPSVWTYSEAFEAVYEQALDPSAPKPRRKITRTVEARPL